MISKHHSDEIKDWVLKNLDFLKSQPNSKPKGHRGVVFGINELQSPTKKNLLLENNFPFNALKAIEEEMSIKFNILTHSNTVNWADLGIMILYSEAGYKCKIHTDDSDNKNIYTTRLNVLLSKPESGGEPIIDKKTIYIKENEPWICVAGRYEHSTVKTKGKTPRILLSYGYDVPRNLLEALNFLN